MANRWHALEPFEPPLALRNGHIQSLYAFVKRRPPPAVTLQRERIDLPDGDFVDIDFAEVEDYPLSGRTPLVLLLHGIEGSADAPYAKYVYYELAKRGIRSVGLNYRGCSGELNRTLYMYHAGFTTDAAFVQRLLLERFPDVPHGLVGVSLGANMLLKYLGERQPDERLRAAVAISPFFDMQMSADVFEKLSRRLYVHYILRSLKRKLRERADRLQAHIDVQQALTARTVRDYDRWVTVPLYEFEDVEAYYQGNSSIRYLNRIKTPTLLIRAVDDPFFSPDDIPYEQVRRNPYLYPAFVEHGGHVGFVEGYTGGFWAERQAARFLAEKLGG